MWYYDIHCEVAADKPGWAIVERVYCFDWDAMASSQYDLWKKALEATPHFVEWNPQWAWFWLANSRDTITGFLNAGMEPPGLHMEGFAPVEKITAVHESILRLGESFPTRTTKTQ